jgi:hypothetical protein
LKNAALPNVKADATEVYMAEAGAEHTERRGVMHLQIIGM